jgi:hypothetical protein
MRLLIILCLSGIPLFTNAQPEKEIKTQIDSLVSYIGNKATESFAMNTVYRGEDSKRKWKDVNDPANPDELKYVKGVIEQFKKAMNGCNYREFDNIKQDKQGEGLWHIYTYACGASKKIHLAFLKIKGKYALGDIDVEEAGEE